MKKTIVLLTLILWNLLLFAQKRDTKILAPQKYSFSANIGFSAVGGLIRLGTSKLSTTISGLNVVKSSGTPALQANFEYKVIPQLSLGASYSYQQFIAEYTGWIFKNSSGTDLTFDVGLKIMRANYAVRAFYNYGNFANADLYSGIRIGYTVWGLSAKIHTPSIKPEDVLPGVNGYLDLLNITIPGMDLDTPKFSFGMFAPQLVLFGYRYYFNNFIGINTELTLGSPSYLSGGLSLRF